nr:NACHT domain-containing protein [uncultured Chryseobacterium sp.]
MEKLDNLDIKKFYTNKKIDEYQHEERLIKNTFDSAETFRFWVEDKEEGQTLRNIVTDKNRVVLLGNPGIGKTKELENLFKNLWNEREETKVVPFFLNIKNFKNNNSFDELIKYNNWKNLDNVCFVIDGLDEIADIQGFISALELFLEKNDDNNIKLVVSCRTNIYEKYLVKIEDSEYFYLQNLTDKQIKNILLNKFKIHISYFELNKYRVFLENPFNLNLFGEFYLENGRFPNNIAEAFKLSINKELQILNKEKFIKSNPIDLTHISKILQKIAITNELMQKNGIEEKDLYLLLGEKEKYSIEKISLLEKIPESTSFIFRHKNYQEFLAALYISELDSDKIIDFIKIERANKTKPFLFNTISFLLNILEDDKLERIKKWLFNNEGEILFLMEPDRFTLEHRKSIFRKYFDDIVINKTFWIGKNGSFPLENIGKFADLDYLIRILNENHYHFRVVISAYTVLQYIDLGERVEEIKNLLTEKLFSTEEKNFYEILKVIKAHKLHLKYTELFKNITDYYKNSYDREINHQIISMLSDFETTDDYFLVLHNCLKKLYKKKPKRERDNIIRGTKSYLEKIFLQINDPENFIKILDIIFNRKYDFFANSGFYDKNYKAKLIEKAKGFVNENIIFLYRITDAFLRSDDTFIYRRDGFLSILIYSSNKKSEVFKYIINNYGLCSKSFYLLTGLYSQENIDYFLEQYKNGLIKIIDNKEILHFRNWVSRDDKKLGYYFEAKVKNLDFVFDEELPSLQKIEEQEKQCKNFIQDNWNILFNKEKLLSEIKNVFKENEVEVITWEKICDIECKWYDKTNYHGLNNNVYRSISLIIIDNGEQDFNSIVEFLNDNYIYLCIIKEHLKSNQNKDYVISDLQINFIKDKCKELSQDFDTERVLKFSDKNRAEYSMYINYFILKLLYFFDQKFNVFYDEYFYLETLRYCNIADFSRDEIGAINFVKSRVNENNFNNQIIKNVNKKHLDYFSLKAHINYSLENKLQETYAKVEEFILDDGYSKDYLETYVKLIPNNISFLKKCCNQNIDSYLCWSAIKILKDNNLELIFLEEIAEKYLAAGKTDYLSSAINILFYLNKDNALKQYYISLKNENLENGLSKPDGFSIEDIQNYTQLNEMEYLENFFYLIYNSENKDTFDFHHSKSFFNNLIIQLSKTNEGFEIIKTVFQKIKDNIQNDDSKSFYRNLILEDAEKSHFESLSKPLTFEKAKLLIEDIEKPIHEKMRNTFNFGPNSTFSGNNQFGDGNTQTNNFNLYSTNPDVLKAEEILNEFQQLKIENEEWKSIFIDGMKDLIDLKQAETEELVQESKTRLRKWHDTIFDLGKRLNDWKNITFLGVEFAEKTPKLLNLMHYVTQFLN